MPADQQIINYGNTANDGTGDPLRTAFIKTDDNFANIWNAGPVGSNITITNNTVGVTNTNGNLVLAPNGIGIIQTRNHVVPWLNNTYDIGSANLKYRSIYGNAVYANAMSLTGDVTIGGNLTVEGDTIQIGNITTDTLTIQLANLASNTTQANGAGITVGANDAIATMLYNSTSNAWVMNIGANIAGNVTAPYFIGNGSQLTGITSYANANAVAYGQAGWAGNIIPATSNVYSLGNATNQWNDLYISNATIYMNNIPISLTAGNVLTVNGANVVTSTAGGNIDVNNIVSSSNIAIDTSAERVTVSVGLSDWVFDETGVLTAPGEVETVGNISAGYFLGNGSQLTGIDAGTGNLDIVGTDISIAAGAPETLINISPSGEGWAYLQLPKNASANSANTRLHNDAGNVEIGTGNFSTGNTSYEWVFGTNGTLTLPGNSQILPAGNTGVRFSAGADDVTGLFLNNAGDAEMYANVNVSIYADSANSGQGWTFDTTGNLTLPNNGSIIVDDDGVVGPDGDDMVISWDNEELILRSVAGSVELQADNDVSITTSYGAGDFQWIFGNNNELVNITGNSAIVTEAGNLAISGGRDGLSSGNVTVRAVDVGVAVRDWTFDNAGDLTVPNYIYFKDGSFIGDEGGALPPVFRVDAPLGLGIDLTTDSDITGNNYTWSFGIDGILTVPGNIASDGNIIIDNSNSGDTADISIYSADDITLQAKNRTTPGPTEGGDLNLYAGSGGIDNITVGSGPGGDIQLYAGDGGAGNVNTGAFGGAVSIVAGNGGNGSAGARAGGGGGINITAGSAGGNNGSGGYNGGGVFITAGDSSDPLYDRGSIVLTSGEGGDETSVGGYVQISIPSVGTNPGGEWVFNNTGLTFEPPPNGEIFNPSVGNLTVGTVGNTIVRTIGGVTTYDWVFDPTGDLILPGGNTEIYVVNAVGNVAGNSISITGGDADQTAYYATPGGNVNISGGLGATNDGGGGGQGGSVNISSGLSADPAGVPGNVNIDTGDYTWTYSYNGDLWLPGGTGYIGSAANTISIYSNEAETNGMLFYDNGGGDAGAEIYASNNFAIFADNDGSGNTWRFYGNALMSAPGDITTTGTISGQTLVSTQSAANEGGEITLALPSSGSTLGGNIIIDSYQNWIRFFEGGGNSRGLYVDVPNVSTSGQYAIGYRDVPQISLSGNVTANSITAGKHFYSTTAGNLQVTIPDNANVAFPTGATITVVVNAAGNVIVAQGTGVSLYMAGSSTTGNRVVGAYGLASIMKVATDTWVISGTGVY